MAVSSESNFVERQDSSATAEVYYTQCHVFVDDSNLWIEGQKYAARKLKLEDVGQDPRFRVDLGRFLDLVVGDRGVTDAFLYGSKPPPNDSVWKAARERNFVVKVFDRAQGMPYGREKEVDMEMGTEITERACECDESERNNTVFVIVTGDRDFTGPIKRALKRKIRVELWAWKTGMSAEFCRLANKEDLLCVRKIDSIADRFSFSACISTRVSGDLDTSRAIVFPDIPNSKKALNQLASDLNRLLRIFYITPIKKSEDLQDLIVVFPKSKLDYILKKLEQHNFSQKACTYAEYDSRRLIEKHQPQKPTLTNRFQALSNIDELDYEDTAEAITGALNVDIEEVITEQEGQPLEAPSDTASTDVEDDDWETVVRRKAGAWTHRRRMKSRPCRWGIHCSKARECPYLHTPNEQRVFSEFPRIKFKFWKTKLCHTVQKPSPKLHNTDMCPYAHTDEDTWCLKCKDWGHSTDNCAVTSD